MENGELNLFHCRRTSTYGAYQNRLVLRVIFEVSPYDTTSPITLLIERRQQQSIDQPVYTCFLVSAPHLPERSPIRSHSCNPCHLYIPDFPIPLSMLTEALVLVSGVSNASTVATCSEQHLGWKGRRVSCCDCLAKLYYLAAA